ncbi:hypothetical protein Acor_65290 [Acrocarpospora corrugata]|uniref:Glycosyl hydrolase family 32 N-terminal domain-containing protein n=1 Tax=Acrocarpospora corrugata TaxID=35763 RepID=A0A5M3WBN0_9ACTN|nr:glycoside hydrolase family 32 protein [Acrocarpospora corrugata]GES04461.1 hypothetical protein Acor_65290 [Acrocarpospora corrugata]
MYDEHNRGQFHFSARRGWINDPNAPLWYDGVYHLYFQHNPDGLAWGNLHWGHATSPDLVHWTEQPIALRPDLHPGNLYSGGGVVDTENVSGLRSGDHAPILLYSGTDGVTLFYSTDGGYTFHTYDNGRSVAVPEGKSRDPKVFRHEPTGRWCMVIWSDHSGYGVDFFTSPNFLDWTFASRYPAAWLYECPDLIPLPLDGNLNWVLNGASGEYVVGDFDGRAFTTAHPEPQRFNHGTNHPGGDYYAGLTFANLPDDRAISIAWQGGNAGSVWTGNLTFPVQFRLRVVDGVPKVLSTPIAELDDLRETTLTWADVRLDTDRTLTGAAVCTVEAEFHIEEGTTRVGFRVGPREVAYDTATATLDGVPMPPDGDTVKIQLLVDRGQLEIFGNDGLVYKSLNADLGGDRLDVFADGGAHLVKLVFSPLHSIWQTGQRSIS